MNAPSKPRPRSLPLGRLAPGHVDDLDRLVAVSVGHPVPHRPRAILGLFALLAILVTLGVVCARGPRSSGDIEETHVVPMR